MKFKAEIKNFKAQDIFYVTDSINIRIYYKMFNVNNNNNSTPRQNAWDQMELFNQLTLRNIFNRRNELGTPELRAAIASMSEEQKTMFWSFWSATQRSWLGCLMAVVSKLL